MKFKPLSAQQAKIFVFPHTGYSALICDGAIRSGKTLWMSVSFILWAMERFSGMNFGICGKTVRSAERNVVTPLLQIASMKKRFKMRYLRSLSLLTITGANGGTNYFYIYGGKDESSYMLIQGITLAGVLLDEVVLMPQSFVNQALSRCSVDGAKSWFSCNPAGPSHWFYNEWIQKAKEKNACYLKFAMTDNPGLSEETLKEYRRKYTGVFYQRYVLGDWVAAEGAIYQVFTERKESFYTEAPDYDYVQIGVDFGGNKSAHAFCAAGLKYDHSKLTALSAERHKATGLTPMDLYRLLDRFMEKVTGAYGIPNAVFVDSAEQTLKNGIKARTRIPVRDSRKNPIIDRVRATTSLMAQGRFYMTHDCAPLEEAFEGAVYSGAGLCDERLDDGTSDIDSLDAFEYSWEKEIKGYEKYILSGRNG